MPLMALLASTPALAAQIYSAKRPFIGLWELNISKSHVRAPPHFAVYRQYEAQPDGWIFETVTTITPRGPRFLYSIASPLPEVRVG